MNDLVYRAFADAPDKSEGKRRQNIHISCDLVGILPGLHTRAHEEMAQLLSCAILQNICCFTKDALRASFFLGFGGFAASAQII